MEISGKTAIVTGAASGIGLGIATALAEAGANVVMADIEKDAHWRERQLLVDVPNGASTVRMHNVIPRLSATPGQICDAGGALGEDNDAVYGDELGLSSEERERLRRAGVI